MTNMNRNAGTDSHPVYRIPTERRGAARRCRDLEAQQDVAFLHALHGPVCEKQAYLDRAAALHDQIIAISNEHPTMTKADVLAA